MTPIGWNKVVLTSINCSRYGLEARRDVRPVAQATGVDRFKNSSVIPHWNLVGARLGDIDFETGTHLGESFLFVGKDCNIWGFAVLGDVVAVEFRNFPAFPGKDRGMIIACGEGGTATHRHHDHRRAERHQALVELPAAHLSRGELLYNIFFFQIFHRCSSLSSLMTTQNSC